MDYDADGDTDIITGSYTGQFYVFRRESDGGFARRELLRDQTGATLLMPFDSVYSVTAELADMDADGDLDLVVGNRSGAVQIVVNAGTREAPVWSNTRRELRTEDGEAIKGSNAHHADWNGDGIRDLIVGSERGEVRWYRNVGKSDAPSYATGELLVEKGGWQRQEEGSTPTRPGQRVKVHVTDWNGDDLADLLVGDVTWQQSTPNPLTRAEEAEKEELEAEYQALRRKLSTTQGTEREELEKAIAEQRERLRPYDRTELHTHGWVWLFLRQRGPTPDRR